MDRSEDEESEERKRRERAETDQAVEGEEQENTSHFTSEKHAFLLVTQTRVRDCLGTFPGRKLPVRANPHQAFLTFTIKHLEMVQINNEDKNNQGNKV